MNQFVQKHAKGESEKKRQYVGDGNDHCSEEKMNSKLRSIEKYNLEAEVLNCYL